MHNNGSRALAWSNSGTKTSRMERKIQKPLPGAPVSGPPTPMPMAHRHQLGLQVPKPTLRGGSVWDSGSHIPAPAWDSGNKTPACGSALGDSDSGSGNQNESSGSGGYNAWGDEVDSSSAESDEQQCSHAWTLWYPSPAPFGNYAYTPGPNSSYDSAPKPNGDNFPSIPAASSSVGSGAGHGASSNGDSLGANLVTPGATPGARMQSIATPGSHQTPQKPTGGSSAPMTPASHFSQAPSMPIGGRDYSGDILGYSSCLNLRPPRLHLCHQAHPLSPSLSAWPSPRHSYITPFAFYMYKYPPSPLHCYYNCSGMGSHHGHYGQAPGYGSAANGVAMSGPSYDWLVTDIEVCIGDDRMVLIPAQYLKTVAPVKNDGDQGLGG
ncbi:MAG: hypothetical protein J3R72DRAFT_511251 [Linnemannia gamsii]|nr:MAG: hypothetical protein J3R72DRAFT_511251 [Linnemannia gamsii]